MDCSPLLAVVISLSTAASSAGVAITAILVNGGGVDSRLGAIERKLDKITTSVEMLNATMRRFDKRLSIIQDRVFNRS